jgi:hypothetical protein
MGYTARRVTTTFRSVVGGQNAVPSGYEYNFVHLELYNAEHVGRIEFVAIRCRRAPDDHGLRLIHVRGRTHSPVTV